MRYTREEIYKIIPNRYPLMVLDTLEINEQEDRAVSEIFLKVEDWFLECHYPGNPIMPLCILIECMTQTFSAIFLSKTGTDEIPVISQIGSVRQRSSATVGDRIVFKAELDSFRRGVAKGRCMASKLISHTIEGTDGADESYEEILTIEITEVLPSMMVRVQ